MGGWGCIWVGPLEVGGSGSASEGQGQQLHLFFTFDLSWWSSSARPSELPALTPPLVAVVI